jgi:hypothetical protein
LSKKAIRVAVGTRTAVPAMILLSIWLTMSFLLINRG